MKKKIGFIASSGGHWEELLCLREIAEDCSAFFVTEKGGQSDDCQLEHLYALPQINRKEKHFVWHFFPAYERCVPYSQERRAGCYHYNGGAACFSVLSVCKMYA